MRHVAIIKDVFRGTPHAIITKSELGKLTVKSVTEYGKSIVGSNGEIKSLDILNIPDGSVLTPFKRVSSTTENLVKTIVNDDEAVINDRSTFIAVTSLGSAGSARVLEGRTKTDHSPSPHATADLMLSACSDALQKTALIAYKTKRFKSEKQLGTVAPNIIVNASKFNRLTNTYSHSKMNALSALSVNKVYGSISSGQLRRVLNDHEYVENRDIARRIARRAKSLAGLPVVDAGGSTKTRVRTALNDYLNRR